MAEAKLLNIDFIEYDNGVFLDTENWNKMHYNMDVKQEEVDLLRAELSKFEGDKNE